MRATRSAIGISIHIHPFLIHVYLFFSIAYAWYKVKKLLKISIFRKVSLYRLQRQPTIGILKKQQKMFTVLIKTLVNLEMKNLDALFLTHSDIASHICVN